MSGLNVTIHDAQAKVLSAVEEVRALAGTGSHTAFVAMLDALIDHYSVAWINGNTEQAANLQLLAKQVKAIRDSIEGNTETPPFIVS